MRSSRWFGHTHRKVLLFSPSAHCRFARSIVHGWGVFADVDIRRDEFVIEYIGELIRGHVADRRQAMYEQNKVDDYMFRLGKSGMVIDATKRGGVARYLNHSCNPNVHRHFLDDGTVQLRALTTLKKGAEIRVSYAFTSLSVQKRRALLKQKYAFDCDCDSFCCLS